MEDRIVGWQINCEFAASGLALGVAAGEPDAFMVAPPTTMIGGADFQQTTGRTRAMDATHGEF